MQCDVLKCEYNSWKGEPERHYEYKCQKKGEKVFRVMTSKQYGEMQTDHNGCPVLVCKDYKARLYRRTKQDRY